MSCEDLCIRRPTAGDVSRLTPRTPDERYYVLMSTSSPRVVFVLDEGVIPSSYGGRVETRRELEALTQAGASVVPVIPLPKDKTLWGGFVADHKAHFKNAVFYRRRNRLEATATNVLLPYTCTTRLPKRRELRQLLNSLEDERPDFVVAAHDWSIPLAKVIGRHLKAKTILRSHNDEASFFSILSRGERLARKVYLQSEAVRLRLSMGRLLRGVDGIGLIAGSDVSAYANYPGRLKVLPPVLTSTSHTLERGSEFLFDPHETILFFGQLSMPQTKAGLLWFVREVLPIIVRRMPYVSLRVAGRSASDDLIKELKSVKNIEYIGAVTHIDTAFKEVDIAINPVFSGSGINMKMGDPAVRGIPIVTTSFGVRGLDILRDAVLVGDDPQAFANACLSLLENTSERIDRSTRVRDAIASYSPDAFAQNLLQLAADC